MANVKISALPAVTTVVPGTDVLPLVSNSGATTTKATPNDIVNATLAAPGAIGGTTPNAITGTSYSLGASAVITESTTSRTLSAGDNGKIIYCTNGSAVTITTAVSLGAGFSCTIIQGGAGQITVAQGASTTLVSYGSLVKTAGQYALASLICPVANTFYLGGNLGA